MTFFASEKKTKEAVDYRYVIIMNNELRILLTVNTCNICNFSF